MSADCRSGCKGSGHDRSHASTSEARMAGSASPFGEPLSFREAASVAWVALIGDPPSRARGPARGERGDGKDPLGLPITSPYDQGAGEAHSTGQEVRWMCF